MSVLPLGLSLMVAGSTAPALLTSPSEHAEKSVLSHRKGSSGIKTQYSFEEQKATRDKVFQKKMQEIISHYSEDGMIWTSPNRELDSFEVANGLVDLQIETKFTEEEKQQVRNGIKRYWCGVRAPVVNSDRYIYTRLWQAVDPSRNILSGRIDYYVWWSNYCDGKENRHPDWYFRGWPKSSTADWNFVWGQMFV